MLYQVTVWTPMKHERGLEVTGQWIVGTLRQAELEAQRLLPPAYETEYSARWGRHPSIDVRPVRNVGRKRHQIGKVVACYETPIRYVPSCDDLGYCP